LYAALPSPQPRLPHRLCETPPPVTTYFLTRSVLHVEINVFIYTVFVLTVELTSLRIPAASSLPTFPFTLAPIHGVCCVLRLLNRSHPHDACTARGPQSACTVARSVGSLRGRLRGSTCQTPSVNRLRLLCKARVASEAPLCPLSERGAGLAF
jgi:hypothetical protein